MGATQTIAWTDNLAADVQIELHNAGGLVQVIDNSTASDGAYDWTIPTNLTAGTDYRIRIASTADAGVFDDSDADFAITDGTAPNVSVTAPNGGESWDTGELYTISWTATDNIAVAEVAIILSLDGGGIKGIVTTIIIQRLTRAPGIEGWLEQVDVIAGT